MSFQIVGAGNGSTVDWDARLKQITDNLQTDGTLEVPTVTPKGESVVITVRDSASGTTRTATLTLPELDGENDDADVAEFLEEVSKKIDSLIDELKKELESLKGNSGSSGSTVTSSSVQKTLFDIYQLIQLMQQLGQKQRDTARSIRYSELSLQTESIKQQAAHQRKAAVLGAIVSAATCVAQIAMIGFSAYKAGQAQRAVNKTAANQQLNMSQDDLSILNSGNDQKLVQIVNQKGKALTLEQQSGVDNEFDAVCQKVAEETGLTEARTKLPGKLSDLEAKFKTDSDKINGDIALIDDQIDALNKRPSTEIVELSDGDLGTRIDEVKKDVYEDPNADPLVQKGDAPQAKVDELKALRAEKGARTMLKSLETKRDQLTTDKAKLKTQLDGDIKAAEKEVEDKLAAYNKALPGRLDTFMTDYNAQFTEAQADAQFAEVNAEEKGGTFRNNEFDKEKVAAEQKVAESAKIRSYAKAKVVQAKRDAGATESLAADKEKATEMFEAQERGVVGDRGYKAAMAVSRKWEMLAQMPNMFTGLFQSISQLFSRDEEVLATKEQAEQTEQQQYREETGKLFDQAQEIVNNARQLLQAVIQAESASMEQIIRA